MTQYLYRPVTHNGAGVHCREPMLTLREARAAVRSLRDQFSDAEVERMLLNNNNSRRYWMWRRKRWRPWDAAVDPTAEDLAHWN